MNKLRGLRVYLSGPIDKCRHGGAIWRKELTPFLQSLNLTIFNPCEKPIDTGSEDIENIQYRKQLKSDGNYDQVSHEMRKISNIDLRMVDVCDFVIVYLTLDIFSCGTIHEIVLANMQKKPIIIMMEEGKQEVPDWLYGRLDHNEFFSNWSQVKNYLQNIDDGTIPPNKRWLFFDKNVIWGEKGVV